MLARLDDVFLPASACWALLLPVERRGRLALAARLALPAAAALVAYGALELALGQPLIPTSGRLKSGFALLGNARGSSPSRPSASSGRRRRRRDPTPARSRRGTGSRHLLSRGHGVLASVPPIRYLPIPQGRGFAAELLYRHEATGAVFRRVHRAGAGDARRRGPG